MNILFVAAEVYPFSKVGGLADVLGALPKALAEKGVNVKVITPGYGVIDRKRYRLRKTPYSFNVLLGRDRFNCSVSTFKFPDIKNLRIYFIENEYFFSSRGVYTGLDGNPYTDNPERFVFFQKAALALVFTMSWKPHIIHCHDNHAAVIPVYLKKLFTHLPELKSIRTLLTIHNIAYQGITSLDKKYMFLLPKDLFFTGKLMEWYGDINPLKAGIICADAVSTVSKTHAQEIMTDEEISAGLKDVIVSRKDPVYGILNGVDYSEWNPEIDPLIYENYSINCLSGKRKNKLALIKEAGLHESIAEKPLLGMVSRLVEHKGIGLVLDTLDRIMAMDVGLVIIGSGEKKYYRAFEKVIEHYPDRIYIDFNYNNQLAHKIIAGCDMFLMPSRFEPCGITQMYSLKYGTVPIVRKTGGLTDTVSQWNGKDGTGFVFNDFTADALLNSITEAIGMFRKRDVWNKIIHNGMVEDFSWEHSANEYIKLYEKVKKNET